MKTLVEQKHKSSIFQGQNSNFTIKKWNGKYNLIQYIKNNSTKTKR
jgi:hypothetical protein